MDFFSSTGSVETSGPSSSFEREWMVRKIELNHLWPRIDPCLSGHLSIPTATCPAPCFPCMVTNITRASPEVCLALHSSHHLIPLTHGKVKWLSLTATFVWSDNSSALIYAFQMYFTVICTALEHQPYLNYKPSIPRCEEGVEWVSCGPRVSWELNSNLNYTLTLWYQTWGIILLFLC